MSRPVVIKVGGSLFAEPGAMAKAAEWLATTRRPGQTRLLIAGGGEAVEAIRRIDSANPMPAEAAHWAAIRIMDASTRLLPAWLPAVTVAESVEKGLSGPPGDWAFPCLAWLRHEEPHLPGERLSIGWQTTSDSIAARVAEVFEADLFVLKHSIEEAYGDWKQAAEVEVVDHEFPRHAAALSAARLVGLIQAGSDSGS